MIIHSGLMPDLWKASSQLQTLGDLFDLGIGTVVFQLVFRTLHFLLQIEARSRSRTLLRPSQPSNSSPYSSTLFR
jgi:hypothetical protein